jgi:hypothetical protein
MPAGGKLGRKLDRAGLGEGDPAFIEEDVQMGREEQAVERVRALFVPVAGGPGLDVGGAQEGRQVEAGDGAAALPVAELVFGDARN